MIKVLNWAVFGQQWKYEDEYYAEIGGKQNLPDVRKMAADLTEWWYPRYYNFACDMGVFECDPMENFGPKEVCSPTWKRDVFARYKVQYEQQKQDDKLTADTDDDTITDSDEENIFYTDPAEKDTDSDDLSDDDEIFRHKSNPKKLDTDNDDLTDGEEVNIHKTNPVLPDTDGDEHPDGVEIKAGTDPLDPADYPVDANGNGIEDEWEMKYGISPQNGSEDTDGEGLSDLLEYKYGTDPTNPDTDGDELTDADEVFLYDSDPLEFTKLSDLGVQITNITDGMTLTDPRPLIQGFAPKEDMEVEVLIRNEFGHEVLLGKTDTGVNNAWAFTPEFDILDGEFYLLAKGLDPENKNVIESPVINVTMDSTLQVDEPVPERLAEENITDEVLIEDVRLVIRDSLPTLIGRTGFKNKVVATWQSVLGTSAIVADLAGGEFKITAPSELPFGEHTVSVYAVRESDQAVSKVITIKFEVKEPLVSILRGVAAGEELLFPQYVWTMIFFAISATLAGSILYTRHKRKKLLKK
jgi:hypothetical protein